MPSILGEIRKIDPDKKRSEKSTSQVLTSNTSHDSRLVNNQYPLSYAKIRELRKDPTVKLAKWAILSQMIHTPWDYVNIRGKASQEMIDLLEETWSPIRDQFLLQAVFGALDFGWQPFEVIHRPENGYVYVDTMKALLQDYTTILVYMDTGRFAGFANETFGFSEFNNSSVEIDEQYSQNINFEVEGTDWYGESVYETLQPISDSWSSVQNTANRYDKKIAGATWVIYYPVGETPYNGITTKNDIIALSILNRLEASGSVAIPDEIQDWADDSIDREAKGKWRIELITADSASQISLIDRQKYLDALKLRAFALTERSLLEGKHGTKEEADVHADVSLSTIDSRHRLITNQLNLHAVSTQIRINFGKKYQWEVGIKPAPLVDTQFALIKEVYRTLLQNPELAAKEFESLNLQGMRTQLGIPANLISSTDE